MLASLLLSILLPLRVPEGFHVQIFARGIEGTGTVLALDDGTVLVSRPAMNDVVALRDGDGDGVADEMRTAVASVERAYGLAMHDGTLYVAGVNRIVSADRLPDGSFAEPRDVVENLPDGGRHPDRSLAFGRDGKLYVGVGSACSECVETHPEHATVLQLDPDGSNRHIFARGLASVASLEASPDTGDLWAIDGGELNRVGDGLHYGWPFCNGHQPSSVHAAPEGISREKFCRSSEAAALELPARASGFTFYRGTQFPSAFQHDAFVASGSKLMRIHFANGKAIQAEDFLDADRTITGVATLPDGSLLFGDEKGGALYRVTYGTAMPPAMMSSSAEELVARPVLSQVFRVSGLSDPSSVLYDEEQDVYFVSSMDGSPGAKDGHGFISRITPDGKIAERDFIDGLDAPKGMAISGRAIWIADIDRLRAFDRVTGAPMKTVDLAPKGALFLEDVAVGPDDALYVTDMDVRIRGAKERLRQGSGRIFRVEADGDAEVAIEGEELRSPSGIAWDGMRFLVAQSYGNEVLAWNRGGEAKAVLRGPGAYDGLVVLPNGTVIVSSHYDDGLHIGRTGLLRPLFTRKPAPGGIGFDRKRNRLLIPSADGDWLEAWTLPPLEVPSTKTARDSALELAALTHHGGG